MKGTTYSRREDKVGVITLVFLYFILGLIIMMRIEEGRVIKLQEENIILLEGNNQLLQELIDNTWEEVYDR